jgi:hypothetical protein
MYDMVEIQNSAQLMRVPDVYKLNKTAQRRILSHLYSHSHVPAMKHLLPFA